MNVSTALDALLVTLGLDASGMTKGAADAKKAQDQIKDDAEGTQKTLDKLGKDQAAAQKKQAVEQTKRDKEAAERNKKVTESLAQVRNQVIGLMAAFTAGMGLKDFVSTLTSMDAAAGRSATNLGISGDELVRWQNVVSRFGGSADGVLGSFKRINDAAMDLRFKGVTPLIQEWMRFGVTLYDHKGKLKDFGQLAIEVSKHMRDVGMSAQTMQYTGKQLGFDEGTINALMKGPEAVQKMLAESPGLDKQAQASADARAQAFARMEQAAFNLGRTIATKLTPLILLVATGLEKLSAWASDHGEALTAVFVGLASVLAVVIIPTVWALLTGFLALSAPVLAVAAAVGAVGAAIYEAYEHSQELGELLGSVFKGIGQAFKDDFGWMLDAINAIDKFFSRHAVKNSGGRGGAAAPSAGGREASAPAAGGKTSAPVAAVAAVPSGRGHGGAQPRGIRNNNPGNLNFVGQAGATKEGGAGGRFAVFGSMEQGIAALARQLELYGKRGNDTIRGIISKLAPPNENNTKAYIETVAKKLGVGAGAHLNLKDPGVLRELIQGITGVEVGRGKVNVDQINAGLALGASGAAQAAGSVTNSSASHVSSSEMHIGNVNITTRDGAGVAEGFQRFAQAQGFVQQSTSGVAG